MRINTSGLYTAPFYKITDLDEGVEYFADMGGIEINYHVVNKECFAGDIDDQNKSIDYMEKLEEEVHKKYTIYQPIKFDAQAAIKCHLIPFDVGNLKDCLVYNSLDYPSNINHYYNLDLYQALVDKSIDKQSHLARALSYGITDGHHSKFLTMENEFTKCFSKELLEEVYNALYPNRGE